jgi:hypothetical protein
MKYTTFEDLQTLGTEKIHERTHISRDKLELFLTKSYAEIGRVQFMGFMSILEREYGIDLHDIKEEYTEFYRNHQGKLPTTPSVILQATSNSRPKLLIAGVALIVMLLVGGYIFQNKMSSEPHEEVMTLTTSAVQVVSEPVELNTTENNETNVTNVVAAVSTQASKVESNETHSFVTGKSLIIRPEFKVWYGMIDMGSGARMQKITSDPIAVDTTKNWLIVLGHGRIEIDTSEGKTKLKEKDTVRFICENGTLKKLSQEEFIGRNGGKNW